MRIVIDTNIVASAVSIHNRTKQPEYIRLQTANQAVFVSGSKRIRQSKRTACSGRPICVCQSKRRKKYLFVRLIKSADADRIVQGERRPFSVEAGNDVGSGITL